MDVMEIGKAISFLRKEAGYTQRQLAELLDISDKAISKWERGAGSPDISLLAKLSIILDTDIESLLEGNISHYKQAWKGVLFWDNSYIRPYGDPNKRSINPEEISVEFFLYDKPLIYYLLSYFLLIGIYEILIICSPKDKKIISSQLQDNKKLGIELYFYSPEEGEKIKSIWNKNHAFLRENNLVVIYDKIFIYGLDLTKIFQRAMAKINNKKAEAVIPMIQNNNNMEMEVHPDHTIKSIKTGYIEDLIYKYDQLPILFCKQSLLDKYLNDCNGFIKILDTLLRNSKLYAEMIGRGWVICRIKNTDDINYISTFIKYLQEHQGMYIACIEEIVWRRGLISKDKMKDIGFKKKDTDYGEYILNL